MEGMIQGVSYEDFIMLIESHRRLPTAGLLPSEEGLRDVRVHARLGARAAPAGEETYPLECYIVTEYEPLIDQSKTLVILRTDADNYEGLVRESRRLQLWIRAQGWLTLFRIDPRYGLVYGSHREPVVPTAAPDFPYILTVQVVTDDPGHPELALQGYVESAFRARFAELFEKYNRTKPQTFRLLGLDLGRLFRRGPEPKARPVIPLSYDLIDRLLRNLVERHRWLDLDLSLIYTNVAEADFRAVPVPPEAIVLSSDRPLRFFHSIEELTRRPVA